MCSPKHNSSSQLHTIVSCLVLLLCGHVTVRPKYFNAQWALQYRAPSCDCNILDSNLSISYHVYMPHPLLINNLYLSCIIIMHSLNGQAVSFSQIAFTKPRCIGLYLWHGVVGRTSVWMIASLTKLKCHHCNFNSILVCRNLCTKLYKIRS